MNNTFRFVNGVNLQQISNAVFDINRRDSVKSLPNNSIIFCKTDFIEELFNELKYSNNKYVLITHCSDYDINEYRLSLKPACIKKWYAQNVNIQHPDLIPYPIGIENHIGPCKGTCIDLDYLNTIDSSVYNISNKIINLLYCNFSLQTNNNRYNVLQTLIQNGIGKPCNNTSYAKYFEELKQYLFIASPRGNGIDCHRTWESMYVGSLPIVERHFMFDSYKNLPIIQIESWDQVTPKFLEPYILNYKNGVYYRNLEELDINYWYYKIKDQAQHL